MSFEPYVAGRCPNCEKSDLWLAPGGYINCGNPDCRAVVSVVSPEEQRARIKRARRRQVWGDVLGWRRLFA